MDTLIIGALLVVGIGAIVALFFVLRSNDTPQVPTPVHEDRQPIDASSNPNAAISVQQEQSFTGSSESDARTVPDIDAQANNQQEQPLKVRLNGQFHELAHGLRTLQQQATEMEQRLGSLNQLIDNIENDSTEE